MLPIYRQDYFGFVYVWYDLWRKKLYIGSHMGAYDDGYVCSSQLMRQAHARRPSDFIRRIVHWHPNEDSKSLREIETKWLQLIPDDEIGKKFYNLKKVGDGRCALSMKRQWTPERRAAHAEKLRAKWEQGTFDRRKSPWTNAQRAAHSQKIKAKWQDPAHHAKVFTEETRQRMSESAQKRWSDPELAHAQAAVMRSKKLTSDSLSE